MSYIQNEQNNCDLDFLIADASKEVEMLVNRRKNAKVAAALDLMTSVLAQTPEPLRHRVIRIAKEDPWHEVPRREGWIFIHIPKTAGQSMHRFLEVPGSWHSTIDQFYAFHGQEAEKAFKFTVVRNPWDRLVSSFHYAKFHDHSPLAVAWRDKWLKDCEDFESFLEVIRMSKRHRDIVFRYHIFRPQVDFICRNDQLVIDKVLRFENLANEIQSVSTRINRDSKLLGHVNRSKRADYKSYYRDAKSVDLVNDIYQNDVKLLNYDFE